MPTAGCSILLQLLGYAVEFVSNDDYLLDTINKLYPLADADSVPTNIKVTVQETQTPAIQLDTLAQFTINDLQLNGKNGNCTLMADRHSMSAQIQICHEMLKSPYLMRHQLFNSACYFLLSYQHITPLHCCAFMIGDHTFTCIGKSGDGKSTLAMAAIQNDLSLLSEDLLFITGSKDITIHSDCREVHLLGDSIKRFPQLKASELGSSHNGKDKYIVPVPDELRVTKIANNQKHSIVFIKPNYFEQSSTIDKYTDKNTDKDNYDQHFQTLFKPNEAGFDLPCLPRHGHINWLSQQPSYVVQMGSDPNQFFHLLRALSQ